MSALFTAIKKTKKARKINVFHCFLSFENVILYIITHKK